MKPLAHLLLAASLVTWPLQPIDDAVQRWVHSHRHDGTRQAMEVVTSKSRLVLFGAMLVGLFTPPGRVFVAELALALVPVNLAVEGLKWTVGRTRPDGDSHRRNSSFPSSHAANAFALAAVLTHRFRKWVAIPAWILAAVVAFSRIYLDRHLVSDIAGGLLIALGGAWLAAWAVERWRERRARRVVPETA